MNSILVVCYSYTGVSRRAAQLLCSHHGWPLGEVQEVQPRGILRCLLDAWLRRQPEICYSGPAPGDFRTVVLVTPIWMYQLAGPMRSFVARERERLQQVAVLVTMNTGGAANAFREVAALLGRAPIRTAAITARSLEDGSGTCALLDFGAALQAGTTQPRPRQRAWSEPIAGDGAIP